MAARILLVGILAVVAVFLITAVLMFLAPYLAIAFVGWAFYKGHQLTKPFRNTDIKDVTPRI
jgi:hypothetical protein